MSMSRREVVRAGLAGAAGIVLGGCHGRGVPTSGAASPRPIIPAKYTLAAGHPRLYVRPGELPALRRRAQTANKPELDSLLAFYNTASTRAASAPAARAPAQTRPAETRPARSGRGERGTDHTDAIVKLALLHLLTGEQAHARACAAFVERLLGLPVQGTYFGAQRRVRALGLAYDWTHDFLDDEFRQRIRESIEAHIQATYESGEAVDEGQYLAGHVANEVPQFLAAGIAIGEDGNGHAMIARCLRYLDRFLQNARFFLEADSFQQSYPYSCTYITEIATVFRLFETGFGQDPAPRNAWFENTIPWWLYPLRSDETFIRFGDYYGSVPLFDNPAYYRPLAYIATRYKNPYARWFAEQFRAIDEFHRLMFPAAAADTPPAKAPADLPRTSFHERMGIAIARGDWDLHPRKPGDGAPAATAVGETGGTVAAFKCSPYYLHNHCHRDANSIVIYHKGDLAIDSGMYDAYETAHWYNYYIRTIAHNSVVVHDPDERFVSRGTAYANDGGQRFINEPHFSPDDYSQLIKSDDFKDGRILRYRPAADHSYVCGDASNCYAKSKLSRFFRHVTFILDWPHPAAVSLLVLDEIELARDGLHPRFLLHCIDEPEVRGGTVTIQQGGGRLTASFLTPVALEKIGGPGKEWFVDGTNYPPRRPRPPHTPGAWRIEASPADRGGRRFSFLTFLTPTDLSAPVPPAPQWRQADGAWIVHQSDLTIALYRGAAPRDLTGGGRRIIVPLAPAALRA